jgi:adenosylcobinamide-GDP ribazoletransferase
VEAFFNAVRFLTVIPVPRGSRARAEVMGRAIAFFPLVGFFIGLITAGLNGLLSRILPAPVTGILLVALTIVLTGGLHLDGLMDTCDGVFVRQTPEERLRIMDDPRVGAFGVTAGILVILTKYTVLASLPAGTVPEALLVMPVVGRFLMTWVVFAFPAARTEGLGWLFKQGTSATGFTVAAATALAMVFGIAGLAGLAITATALIIISLSGIYIRHRLGGLTGDTYGALNELAEVLVLVMFSGLAMLYPVGL